MLMTQTSPVAAAAAPDKAPPAAADVYSNPQGPPSPGGVVVSDAKLQQQHTQVLSGALSAQHQGPPGLGGGASGAGGAHQRPTQGENKEENEVTLVLMTETEPAAAQAKLEAMIATAETTAHTGSPLSADRLFRAAARAYANASEGAQVFFDHLAAIVTLLFLAVRDPAVAGSAMEDILPWTIKVRKGERAREREREERACVCFGGGGRRAGG